MYQFCSALSCNTFPFPVVSSVAIPCPSCLPSAQEKTDPYWLPAVKIVRASFIVRRTGPGPTLQPEAPSDWSLSFHARRCDRCLQGGRRFGSVFEKTCHEVAIADYAWETALDRWRVLDCCGKPDRTQNQAARHLPVHSSSASCGSRRNTGSRRVQRPDM